MSTVRSRDKLATISHCVNLRRWYVKPEIAGVALAELGPRGGVLKIETALVCDSDEFSVAAILADIAHHRSGRAVYPLDYIGTKDLEEFCEICLRDSQRYPFAKTVYDFCKRALTTRQHRLFAVFVGPCDPDWQESSLAGRKKVLNQFLHQTSH